MVDKPTILQIFGSLMKHPQFLSETDKYNLTPEDFYYRFDKYIFVALDTLYRNGAARIKPIDIENFLATNATAALVFKQQNGIEYLQDAEFLSEEQNFPYYYNKLKKFNLLERLKNKGIQTDKFYIEELTKPKALEVNEKFETLELADIINEVKKDVSLIESDFVKNSEIESWNIEDDIDSLIDGFGAEDAIGLPINGVCVSKIINGAELGALTIRSAATGIGKTRYAVGDACKLAYPFTYNTDTLKWEKTGFNQSVLFICTEQKPEQIEKMILAYLTGINESKFKYAYFNSDEKLRIHQAAQIIKDFPNLHLMRIPDPNVELIKVLVREQVILHEVRYCFFDYIFASGALYKEFRGNNLRTDEALLLLSTALKDIAIEQNISVFTSTQLNAKGDDNKDIRNESTLSGSRAIANKCDNGLIVARPTKEEIDFFTQEKLPIPNRVTDVYKTRSSQWNYIRIWSNFDAGTCRNTDLFVTDNRFNTVEGFYEDDVQIEWEISSEIQEYVDQLNKG